MSERKELNEEVLEEIVGGNLTFDWDGKVGHIGLNGDKSYTFSSRSAMIANVTQSYQAGKTDAEALQALIAAGIIWQ